MMRKYAPHVFGALWVLAGLVLWAFFIWQGRAHDWLYFDSMAAVMRSSVWHYGVFPLHDPWVCSGHSLLANPQTWMLSPTFLVTLFSDPTTGNILSFLIFKIVGFIGAIFLFRSLKASSWVSVLLAAAFVNLNWFALHFAEGHIIYRGFYLLPWILYYENIFPRRHAMTKILALMALMVMDGGIYPFLYAVLYLVLLTVLRPHRLRILAYEIKKRPLATALPLAGFFLVLVPKLVPLFTNPDRMKGFQEAINLPASYLADALFNAFLSNEYVVEANLRFHEVGAYFGIALLVIVAIFLFRRTKPDARTCAYLILAVFFLWTGSGWGTPWNPYTLIAQLPLFQHTHVQTRYLILFLLSFYAAVAAWSARVPQQANTGPWIIALLFILNAEVLLSSWNAFPANVYGYDLETIKKENWSRTVPLLNKPMIYYADGVISKACYEPSQVVAFSAAEGEPGYKGEVYADSAAAGTVTQLKATPGRLSFHATTTAATTFTLNENFLEGWATKTDGVTVADKNGLVQVSVPAGEHDVILEYRPWYWPWVLIFYVVGIVCFAFGFRSQSVADEAPL